ncbi:PD-(D/E)XK nuclease family protein [Bifidobacterium gallicum]|uniref:PD-(D/E)XK nuclease superfamily protein n=1 Tax=Bifidobacterium gallicum DSM 20093 = LMG 11596 TaxID=561180 RepID=A0A087ALN3_9BIFI|nr:PD-(D/E)XK nuclease family protein [Bifidobacterium gallicum]KFI59683.1 hypothetical protein BGLCM_0353 [Bifidobacterium gallicum DSM 20093 = LMG 11596]
MGNNEKNAMEGLISQLEQLAQQPKTQALLLDAKTPNFWSILEYGRESYETRFCKMLRWLLDPTANHGLGDAAMRWIANYAGVELTQSGDTYVPDDQDGAETEALGNHIDVFAHDRSAGLLVVIEAKMGSDEHESDIVEAVVEEQDAEGKVVKCKKKVSQLEKYYETVDGHALYGDKRSYPHAVYLFLTIDGHRPPSFPENEEEYSQWQYQWHDMSYADLVSMLDDLLPKLTDLDAMKLVKDFRINTQSKLDLEDDAFSAFEPYKENIDLLHTYFVGDNDEDGGDDSSMQEVQEAGQAFQLALGDRMPFQDAKMLVGRVYEALCAGKQVHTKNVGAQRLVRRIFNLYALNKLPGADDSTTYGKEPKESRISPTDSEAGNNIVEIKMTSGKGQGLTFFPAEGTGEDPVYLSGDTRGVFPNDPISVPRGMNLPRIVKSDVKTLQAMDDESLRAQINTWIQQSRAIAKARREKRS